VGNLVVLFAFYFINYFVIIFFNTAIVACATIRMRGGNPTVGDGLQASGARLFEIAGWALVSASVGLVLRMIEERSAQRGVRQVFHDARGHPVKMVLPDGSLELREFDAAGRLLFRFSRCVRQRILNTTRQSGAHLRHQNRRPASHPSRIPGRNLTRIPLRHTVGQFANCPTVSFPKHPTKGRSCAAWRWRVWSR
jgi:hypothetical protein